MRRLALELGAHAAERSTRPFERGGEGAVELAEAVVDAAEQPSAFELHLPARRADRRQDRGDRASASTAPTASFLLPAAENDIKRFTEQGLDTLPICMAKTHLSLSHDPTLLNAPTGFTVPVRDVRAYTGAGWLVAALRRHADDARACRRTPAAFNVDIDENGTTVGLF